MVQRGGSRKSRRLPQPGQTHRKEALTLTVGALKAQGFEEESNELAGSLGYSSVADRFHALSAAIDSNDWQNVFEQVDGLSYNSQNEKQVALEHVSKQWIKGLVKKGDLTSAVKILQNRIFPILPAITRELCWSLFATPGEPEPALIDLLSLGCKNLTEVNGSRLAEIVESAKAFQAFNGEVLNIDSMGLIVSILEAEGFEDLAQRISDKAGLPRSALREAIVSSEWERAVQVAGDHMDLVLRYAVNDLAGTAQGVELAQKFGTVDNRKELSELLMKNNDLDRFTLLEKIFPTHQQVFEFAQNYEIALDDYYLGGSHCICVPVQGSPKQFPRRCFQDLSHDDEVWEVAVSECGKLIASGTKAGTIYIWSLQGRFFRLHSQYNGAHSDGVQALDWNGHILLSGGEDGVFTIVDADKSSIVLSHQCTNHSEKPDITAVAWYKDTFFTGSYDGQIVQWNMQGEKLWCHKGLRVLSMTLEGSTLTVLSVMLKGKGHTLLRVNLDTKAAEHSTIANPLASLASSRHCEAVHAQPSGVQILGTEHVLKGPVQTEMKIRGSFGGPMDKYYVSGSEDGYVYVFNAWSYTCVQKLKGHRATVNTAKWCPGDSPKFLVSAGDDHKVKIWRP